MLQLGSKLSTSCRWEVSDLPRWPVRFLFGLPDGIDLVRHCSRSALLRRLSSLLDLALQLLTFMRISLLMAAVILSLGRAAQHTHARAWAVR